MKTVTLPESFQAWRTAARQLLQQEVCPAQVLWSNHSELGLDFNKQNDLPSDFTGKPQTYRVSKHFLNLAESVSCHRNPIKWEMLYRMLWKLTHEEPRLLQIGLDLDLIQCKRMICAIRRDCHKMKAFVRFREIMVAQGDAHHKACFVAWFEPEHFIVPRIAPFFKQRFANMHWSILTPDICAHWDEHQLWFTAGVDRTMAPQTDNFEQLWRTYYTNIFNPARLKPKAMLAEMPKKYWKNLPEASLIQSLIRQSM